MRKHCVLAAAADGNTDVNPNNIIFIMKDTKLYVPSVTFSEKYNKKQSKLLSKGLIDKCIGMNIKQKVKIKMQ